MNILSKRNLRNKIRDHKTRLSDYKFPENYSIRNVINNRIDNDTLRYPNTGKETKIYVSQLHLVVQYFTKRNNLITLSILRNMKRNVCRRTCYMYSKLSKYRMNMGKKIKQA